jgi:hypothetical protein
LESLLTTISFSGRALVDWTFKLFAWISVVAALQVAG